MVLDTLRYILQGRWLGHPLHPILAHLPTALFPAALLFDILSRTSVEGRAFVVTSNWCIAVGLIAVLGAAPTGLADFSDIRRDKPAWKIGLVHAALNVLVAILFLVNFLIRPAGADQVAVAPLTLTVIGNAVLVISGWLGGRLIYNHGINVARMSKQKWRRIAEAGGAVVPPQQQKGS